MNISYEGIGHLSVTFPAGDCEVGQVCKLDGSGNAVKCGSGEDFIGFVESVHGSSAAVQVEGFACVPYNGIFPTCGYVGLAGDGAGKVTNSGEGKKYLVVNVDQINGNLIIKL